MSTVDMTTTASPGGTAVRGAGDGSFTVQLAMHDKEGNPATPMEVSCDTAEARDAILAAWQDTTTSLASISTASEDEKDVLAGLMALLQSLLSSSSNSSNSSNSDLAASMMAGIPPAFSALESAATAAYGSLYAAKHALGADDGKSLMALIAKAEATGVCSRALPALMMKAKANAGGSSDAAAVDGTTTTDNMNENNNNNNSSSSSSSSDSCNNVSKHLFAVFAGQHVDYIEDLQHAWNHYPTIAQSLISRVSDALVKHASSDMLQKLGFHTRGLPDVASWAAATVAVPPADYLMQAPVSFPCIFLAQIVNYAIAAHESGLDIGAFRARFGGATGHSQGIAGAVAMSLSGTSEELARNACDMAIFLLVLGSRCQQATTMAKEANRHLRMPPKPRRRGKQKGTPEPEEENPTPMLAVIGLPTAVVQRHVDQLNKLLGLSKEIGLAVAIENGPSACVVAGAEVLTNELRNKMGEHRAAPGETESRVPFRQRKLSYHSVFLNASAPFHHPGFRATVPVVVRDCQALGIRFSASALALPVYSTSDGTVLTSASSGGGGGDEESSGSSSSNDNLIEHLAAQIAYNKVNWPAAVAAASPRGPQAVSSILDFGPSSGVAAMTARNLTGTGVNVFSCAPRSPQFPGARVKNLLGTSALLSTASAPAPASDWTRFCPRIATRPDGRRILHTRLSQLTGKAPLLVAGMTPTTSYNGVHLVAACANAGYHVELAAGGLSRPAMFEERLRTTVSLLQPGVGISLNLLYLNAKQWGFQFDLALKLRRQGLPVEAITVAAGVPTPEVGVDIITRCQAAGLKYIGFKPGSLAAIHAVLDIAKAASTFPVVMQWTGGRGGGHHSYEDMHQPVLDAYATIRNYSNVVLVAGSGFGDAPGSWPYLSGEWSTRLGYPAMPFDGALLASRMMVAREAATARTVKALLVATPGVEDQADWEQSYEGDAGGVITVRSELGEPIHKIATRGMLLWKDFDTRYFSKKRGPERENAIAKDKDLIIERINADFQKLYFGRKTNGAVADLEEMTYYEVAARMAELMYVSPEKEAAAEEKELAVPGGGGDIRRHDDWRPTGRWLHPTFRSRLFRFCQRAEERLMGSSKTFYVTSESQVDEMPSAFVDQLFERFPEGRVQILCEQDVDFFFHLCRTGGKPVNFVPTIDGDLEVWFKKDSLWYSEDLASLPEQDAMRACILQGPVSVRHSTKIDEPAADILNAIHDGYLALLEKRLGGSSDASASSASGQIVVPPLGGLALSLVTGDISSIVTLPCSDGAAIVSLPAGLAESSVPEALVWCRYLAESAGCTEPAIRAALCASHVASGGMWLPNPIQRLFAPAPGVCVRVTNDSVTLLDMRSVTDDVPAVRLALNGDGQVSATLYEERPETADMKGCQASLDLRFSYDSCDPLTPIHQLADDLVARVQRFFRVIWFGDADWKETMSSQFTVTTRDVSEFNNVLGYPSSAEAPPPLDMVIVVAWKPLVAALCSGRVGGNVLELVHLGNEIEALGTGPMHGAAFEAGQEICTRGRVVAIENGPTGSTVKVEAFCTDMGSADSKPYIKVISRFFFRGHAEPAATCFSEYDTLAELKLVDAASVAVLCSRPWAALVEGVDVAPGDVLTARVHTREEGESGQSRNFVVTGTLTRTVLGQTQDVFRVDYKGLALANPVTDYLARTGSSGGDEAIFFENGGYLLFDQPLLFVSPTDNAPYACVSRDLNPIHRNPHMAAAANLPGTIVHGMWSSAMARKAVVAAAGGIDGHVTRFTVDFDGMVLPGEELFTQVRHVGMRAGKRLLEVETVNAKGNRVLHGSAEAHGTDTAFVFTGQGSAEVNMGMALYTSSPVARTVWDEADEHLRYKYGFSILEIVRTNPQRLTIHFGGRQGSRIRQNYLDLQGTDAEGNRTQLLADIGPDTESYTFLAPDGLLFSSQFTQCALVLQEKAALDDMLAQGLLPDVYYFAGHSLGEYAGLTAAGNLLTVDALVDIVFFRGLVMQRVVKRDASGRSEYGMVAANPLRVGPFLTEKHLHTVVDTIEAETGQLLQVVNYNVQGLQYVVAGHVVSLKVLNLVLTRLKKLQSPAQIESLVKEMATEVARIRQGLKAAGKPFTLERGAATIPLPGIDVPFHSRFLSGGVDSFRESLKHKLDKHRMHEIMPKLVGRYIPNVTAKPFSVAREYIEMTQKETGSAALAELLAQWESVDEATACYTLVVELLAFQFASPVRWIETQHYLFSNNVKRVVEIGPAPTLTNMALTTLQSKAYGNPKAYEVRFYGRDEDNEILYYRFDDAGQSLQEYVAAYTQEKMRAQALAAEPVVQAEETPSAPALANTAATTPPPAPASAPAPVAAAPPPSTSSAGGGGGSPPPDAPVSPLEVLQVLLALKLKLPLESIQAGDTMSKLVGGKSAVQNELLGELEKEFGAAPDDAAEMSLEELAKTLGAGYTGLGKQTQGLVNKLVSTKMPGGFGRVAVESHLVEERGLGPGRIDGLLLHGLTLAPGSRLGDTSAAHAWLASVADSYSKAIGMPVPRVTGGGGGGGVPVQMMAMPAAAASAPAAAAVPDAPVAAVDTLRVLLATKTNKSLADVPASATIKGLVGGNSALGNEVVGDLDKEFNGTPDGADDMTLDALAAEVGAGYKTLGPTTSALTNKLVSAKMPGGFGLAAVNEHLSGRGLGPGHSASALLHALTMAPSARLGDAGAAAAFLDSVVASYGSYKGVNFSAGGGGGGGGGGMVVASAAGPAVSSKALKQVSARIEALVAAQMEAGTRFLDKDPHALDNALEDMTTQRNEAEAALDNYQGEFGDDFLEGIARSFDGNKIRTYSSYWNWARQALHELFYDFLFRRRDFHDGSAVRIRDYILRASTPGLVVMANHLAERAARQSNWRVSRYMNNLATDAEASVAAARPMARPVIVSHAPTTTVTKGGHVSYSESPRPGTEGTADFVRLMQAGPPAAADDGASRGPYIQLKARSPHSYNERVPSPTDTKVLFECLEDFATRGICFADKVALVTGCGRDSIGIELVKMLLQGGCTVVATTSSFSRKKSIFYQQVYQQHGAAGAALHVLPFNQGSARDVAALIKFIYAPRKGSAGLGLDIDFVFPFAAISENGRTIEGIDARSELAHRLMTTNLVRMLGAVATAKRERGILTRPASVVLPMSPNHGLFGSDGLYAESKMALESLLNKRDSEGWSDYLNMVGAVIGWTRGTGLMSANNATAQGVEALGCWTFSTVEMAFVLVGLLHPRIARLANNASVWADYSGGFDAVKSLRTVVGDLRGDIAARAQVNKTISEETRRTSELEQGPSTAVASRKQRAGYTFEGTAFPQLPSTETLDRLSEQLQGMIDLAQTVVVVGYGETGPWGGARTRWEMECHGEFSLEGCIELAWVTGLIRYHSGRLPTTGEHYNGWVDAVSGEPVGEHEVKEAYEPTLLKSCGIRLLEPELFEGYDPHRKQFLQQVALDADMPWVDVADRAEAEEYRFEMGREAVAVRQRGDGQWQIRVLRGATVAVPRALSFDRFVAGQVPTGWDAKRYGVPDEILNQVDRVTLYSLVATAEALTTAGIVDPYEFYEYVHVSGVGNTVGGGFGGMNSFRRLFHDRKMDNCTQGDILQESFINTVPAWINMLLLSSSGPVKTPVGACATAAESLEIGAETILSGKAAIVICGGYDDIGEESMYEFAQMKATSSAAAETSMGREPAEMCRPTTDTRAGFMEAHGAGVQVLMSGAVAVAMGCPIYGVVALTSTATDKEGRSVPAPGQGILTTCRERPLSFPSPLLDLSYRRRNLKQELERIDAWRTAEGDVTRSEAEELGRSQGKDTAARFLAERHGVADAEAARMRSRARSEWGNNFFRGRNDIAPVRGALAVWGLTVDDICVASFHGTSTKANDKNESMVTQQQMEHLGRTPGNPVMVVCQKWLTGHPKGAAAAWMTNGLLQCMNTGHIPGNRNADNIDKVLEENDYLVYPNASVRVDKVHAALLKSFGFGQAGAELVLVHPDYLLASLSPQRYDTYVARRALRETKATRTLHRVLTGKVPLLRVKSAPPYTDEQQNRVYLDPTARAEYDPAVGSWRFADEAAPKSRQTAPAAALSPEPSVAVGSGSASASADVNSSITKRYDRREAEVLLSALRRGNLFGKLTDPAQVLEDRHHALVSRRPGEAPEEDEVQTTGSASPDAQLRTLSSPAGSKTRTGRTLSSSSSRVPARTRLEVTMREAAEGVLPAAGAGGDVGIGIDVEPVKTFEQASRTFLDRNFTAEEQAYCQQSPHTAASFAGRWAAKEAVIKAISSKSEDARNLWQGSAAPLSDIEVLRSSSGAPRVTLYGHAKAVAATLGVHEIKVSISHVADHAVAQAVTR